jgi:hypothetical protein
MAKNFLKSDALAFFKKGILAGGVTKVDDKILNTYFDNFLESNKSLFLAGDSARAIDSSVAGVKKKIKSTDYDWNKVIGKIGEDFGYEINFNNVKSLDNIALEGNTYAIGYERIAKKANLTTRKNLASKKRRKDEMLKKKKENLLSLEGEVYDVDADVANAFNGDTPIDGIPQYRRVGETSGPQRYKYENGEVVSGPTQGLTGSINDRLTQKRIKDYEQIDAELEKKYPKRDRNGNRKERTAYEAYMQERQQRYDQVNKRLGYTPKVQRGSSGEIIDGDNDLEVAQSVVNNGTGKDGIGLWGHMKKHPVISTAAVVGTVWGASELLEDDDF